MEDDVLAAVPYKDFIVNWPIFLVKNHPMNMWNFAVGGASVNQTITPGDKSCYPMTEQFKFFENQMAVGQKYSNWSGLDSLVSIWFGINDILIELFKIYEDNNWIDKWEETAINISKEIVDSMFNIVNKLHSHGVYNFLFITVPPMEKIPEFKGNDIYSSLVSIFNSQIIYKAGEYQTSHTETNVFVYNAYDEFNYLLEHKFSLSIIVDDRVPEEKESMKDLFFWRDGSHASNIVHRALAADIEKFLLTVETVSHGKTGYVMNLLWNPECETLEDDYPCCSKNNSMAYYRDKDAYGIENNKWCGLVSSEIEKCFAKYLGFPCCGTDVCNDIIYEDIVSPWDKKNNLWCAITPENTLCQTNNQV